MRPGLSAALQELRRGDAPAYSRNQACLAWADQGVVLAEFARGRGLDLEDWCAEAGVRRGAALSPAQLLALLRPLLGLGADAPFVIGQLWWPGHYGLASQALMQAADTHDAARRLARLAGRLSPLLGPRVLCQGERLWLVFTEACGLPPAQRAALVDLHLAAFAGFADWRAGERLPWRFHFNRTAPRDSGLHLVMLGPELQFDCQVDALSLPLEPARRAWPGGRAGACALAALEAGADPQALRRGWLALQADLLLEQLCLGEVSLEGLAQQQGLSTATLKRQFAAHGSHYQAELDRLRVLVSLTLIQGRGWRPREVGAALGFVDPANFRRSFRRWTGLLPSQL